MYVFFICSHNGIGYEEKVKKENLDSGIVVKWNESGVHNGILNELRLNEF